MSKPMEPMTPPPDYDEVMSGKEKPPSYESQTLTSQNNIIIAQPSYTASTDTADSQNNRPRLENENEYENGLGCEPFYDPARNNCLVCLFCNIFCHPITFLVHSCENSCCNENDERDRLNRAESRSYYDNNMVENNYDYAGDNETDVEYCFETAGGNDSGGNENNDGDNSGGGWGGNDEGGNSGGNNGGGNCNGNDGEGDYGGFSGGGDCGGGDSGGGGDCGGSCD